jgi:hypothetical protein
MLSLFLSLSFTHSLVLSFYSVSHAHTNSLSLSLSIRVAAMIAPCPCLSGENEGLEFEMDWTDFCPLCPKDKTQHNLMPAFAVKSRNLCGDENRSSSKKTEKIRRPTTTTSTSITARTTATATGLATTPIKTERRQ